MSEVEQLRQEVAELRKRLAKLEGVASLHAPVIHHHYHGQPQPLFVPRTDVPRRFPINFGGFTATGAAGITGNMAVIHNLAE